jgi:hypothetical protein
MDTTNLKELIERHRQAQAIRLKEQREKEAKRLREAQEQIEQTFDLALSAEAAAALEDAGFRWAADVAGTAIELMRDGCRKPMTLQLVYGYQFRWGPHLYDLSSPEEELNLLSEIAFQFGI